MAGLGPLFYVFWLASAAQFAWQARKLRLDDPALALRLFKSNRDAGLLLAIGFALGAVRL